MATDMTSTTLLWLLQVQLPGDDRPHMWTGRVLVAKHPVLHPGETCRGVPNTWPT
jgi:hypothetical protein